MKFGYGFVDFIFLHVKFFFDIFKVPFIVITINSFDSWYLFGFEVFVIFLIGFAFLFVPIHPNFIEGRFN